MPTDDAPGHVVPGGFVLFPVSAAGSLAAQEVPHVRTTGGQGNAAQAGTVPAASQRPSGPPREPKNALRLGPRSRRLIRAAALVVNPLVLRVAGRRHMPIIGIVHHRGRRTGRPYATPLGVRPAPGGGFVMPLTFSEASQWYQNILAAGECVITYRGADHTVARPVVVDRATAGRGTPGMSDWPCG
jgi:deazaflavin-dependent oxidoreductase (nitroreductase family)